MITPTGEKQPAAWPSPWAWGPALGLLLLLGAALLAPITEVNEYLVPDRYTWVTLTTRRLPILHRTLDQQFTIGAVGAIPGLTILDSTPTMSNGPVLSITAEHTVLTDATVLPTFRLAWPDGRVDVLGPDDFMPGYYKKPAAHTGMSHAIAIGRIERHAGNLVFIPAATPP
jgi:hypothetical protein